MIKAVVYDLDDTLFPEASFRESGFRFIAAYLKKCGYPVSVKDIDALYKRHPQTTFNELVKRNKLPFDVAELVELYRTHPASIRLFPGAKGVLSRLRKKYALGLITDHYAPMQRTKVKALGLAAYFTHVIYSSERNTSKPDVALFEEMKKRLHAGPGEVIYVADNEQKDFIGARAAGYSTIKYKSNGVYKDHKGTKKYKADYEIRNHEEIFPLLKKSLNGKNS